MAGVDKRLTDLTEKASATDDAFIHIVEPGDISQSPSGSSYKIKTSNLIPEPSSIDDTADHEKGEWKASTNTPTLANGIGQIGDHYKVSVAGTQFSISFGIGDIVAYDGSVWYKFANNNQTIDTTADHFKGNWNASTNIPTLTNGVGQVGDWYAVETSGYIFGDVFFKDESIFYNGSTWVKKSRLNFNKMFPHQRYACVNGAFGIDKFGFFITESGTITGYNLQRTGATVENIGIFREVKTAASSGSIAKWKDEANSMIPTQSLYDVGFYCESRFHEKTPNVLGRFYIGLSYGNTSMGNVNPSAYLSHSIGVGLDTGDANYQLIVRESASTVTKYDTGLAKGSDNIFTSYFYRPKGSTIVTFVLKNEQTGATYVKQFTYSDDIPRKTLEMSLNNAASSSAFGIGYAYMILNTN